MPNASASAPSLGPAASLLISRKKYWCGPRGRCATTIRAGHGSRARLNSRLPAPLPMACVIPGMGAMPPDGPVWGADPEVAKEVQQLRRLNTDAEFSEDGLALEFSARHADTLRYVSMWGSWYWNGQQWQRERTLKVYDEARIVCRE